MKITTQLLSGAGNTFHVMSAPTPQLSVLQKQKLVIEMCEKFPADGFVFLDEDKIQNRYIWDFYNRDGSLAEMCGNAARCVGYYIKNILKPEDTFYNLITVAGLITITPLGEEDFLVQTSPVKKIFHPMYFYCNTGVPHVVKVLSENESFENQKNFARSLRSSAEFHPQGTNVTLLKMIEKNNEKTFKAVTFERGVEDFTLACGTGALAVGFYCKDQLGLNKIRVEMPGGVLIIDLSDTEKPFMSGPAIKLRSCNYEFE